MNINHYKVDNDNIQNNGILLTLGGPSVCLSSSAFPIGISCYMYHTFKLGILTRHHKNNTLVKDHNYSVMHFS